MEAKSSEYRQLNEFLEQEIVNLKEQVKYHEKTLDKTASQYNERLHKLEEELRIYRLMASEALLKASNHTNTTQQLRATISSDLKYQLSRNEELETENSTLIKERMEQDNLLKNSIQSSLELTQQLSEQEKENWKTLKDYYFLVNNDGFKKESEEFYGVRLQEEVNEIEQKYVSETLALQQELDRLRGELLEHQREREDFFKDMETTVQKIGEMKGRLEFLSNENNSLKLQLEELEKQGHAAADQETTTLEPFRTPSPDQKRSRSVRSSPHHDVPSVDLQNLVSQLQEIQFSPPESDPQRLGTLRTLIESVKQVDPRAQLRVGQQDLVQLLSTIQDEAEQLAVYSSTVATTAFLRKHKSSPSEQQSSPQNLQRNDQMVCLEDKLPPTSSSSPKRGVTSNNSAVSALPKSVYEELDSNQQGDVSEEEFVEVLFQKPQLLKTLNAPIPRSQSDRERVYRRLFNSMNRSQSGYLTYEEVESYVSDQQQLQLQPRQSQSQSQSQSQESQQEQRQGQAGRDEAQTVSLPSRQPPSQLSPSSSSQRNPSRSRSRGRYDEEEQDLEQDLKQQHSTAQGRGEIGREQRPRQDQGGQGQDRRVSSRSSSPDKLLQLGRIPSGELDENVFVEDDSNSEGEGEGDESPQRQRSRVFGDQSPSRQPPPSQRPSYADMFKLIDRNSDGRLSLMEFMQALRRHPLLAEVSSLLFHSSHLIDSCTLSFSFLFLSFQH
jgi:Ca2+-binding EF-hand superfamily protein